MKFKFKEKSLSQLKQNHYSREVKNLNDFKNFEDFKEWYDEEPKICKYCGIDEKSVQKIVTLGLLKSKRFPENGITRQGKARGMWLEVDRIDPLKNYSKDNCALACYFCNNDKSDVFNAVQYKEFFQNRKQFLNGLVKNID